MKKNVNMIFKSENYRTDCRIREAPHIFRILTLISVFIFLFSSILYSNTDDFLQILKQREDQVKSLQADMEMVIDVGPGGRLKQTGKYYYQAPDKLRMDILSPIKQSIILIGQKVYLKTIGSSKFIESSENDIQAKLYSSDIYGYHYLNQYVYETITNAVLSTNIPRQIYMGYEIINKKKVPRVKVYYNKTKGVVEEYSIIGNAIIPAVRVKYNYKKINGLLLPAQILTRVNYQMGQSDCLIRLRNQRVNEEVDNGVFPP